MKKRNLSRITIDIPEEDHKDFKILAAILGKSMRDLVVESIQKQLRDNKVSTKSDRLNFNYE